MAWCTKRDMKNAVAPLVLITLLIVACDSPISLPNATSDLPKATSTLIPTRTATATLTPEVSFYQSEEFGFRLQPSAGYRIEELPIRKGMQLAIGFAPLNNDQTQRFGFPIGLTVYEKPPDVSLLDWLSIHIGDLTESGQPTSEQAFFYAPIIQNQNDFKGEPALQYESGSRPVPYETLVDRGAWVIGFYYLRDYPDDYEPVYEQMLASLEFFNPTGGQIATAPRPLPTATPTVCLDENAEPRALPPRQTPLEVHFTSSGNVWIWEETSGLAQQISKTGDARSFHFSPDGQVIAFTRGPLYGQTELWGISRDGTNLRLLASADQLHALVGEPSTTEHPYADEIVYRDWIEGTHSLGFEIQRNYDAIGGCCDFGGYWQVNVDTGDLSAWTPPPEIAKGLEGWLSPDGSQVAIITGTTVSLTNADGSNRRENVFSFNTALGHEGGFIISPDILWANDSQSLLAITFNGDVYSDDTTSTTWRIPLDGSPAQELHTFQAPHYWVNLSPNQKYLVYQKRARPMTNDYELYLATFDGSSDMLYIAQHGLEFLHWHPDSYHFVYAQWNIFRPFLGSVCGGSVPLLDSADTPATHIQWVDATRFLFAKGSLDPSAGPRELRLGQLGGPSILLGPFNGETAHYLFNIEEAPLGQE